MIHIRKQRTSSGDQNKGIRITRNSKGEYGFNLTSDVVQSLPQYVEIMIDNDQLYLLESDNRNGFKVSIKRDCGAGRFDMRNEAYFEELAPFVGNHYAYRDERGVYVRPERRIKNDQN